MNTDMERAIEILEKLNDVISDLSCRVVYEDTISAAAAALELLGPNAGDKIEAMLRCLANGNPKNLDELRGEAPRHLIMEIPA